MEVTEELLANVVRVVDRAGEKIMSFYVGAKNYSVQQKSDLSPVTDADLAANDYICEALSELATAIPVLSEESVLPAYSERKAWQAYWLVDPLDGTRGFVSGDGQFTVNIALVVDGEAVLGVVGIPVEGRIYAAAKGLGAFLLSHAQDVRSELSTRLVGELDVVAVARGFRRNSTSYDSLIANLDRAGYGVEEQRIGSAIKMCRLAAGEVDLYPCFVPTSEWDTAAGQAVVEQAGGVVIDLATLKPLRYNQKESLINPDFMVVGDPNFSWLTMMPGSSD